MKNFAENFEEIIAWVMAKQETDSGCHDFDHTWRVLKNAEHLAGMEKDADLKVVRLAALLHDVARCDETASQGRICHAEAGAEAARTLLAEYGFDQELIIRVERCILKHRYRSDFQTDSIEEKIIYDADKLDAIGAVGIGRAFHFAGRFNARLHNTAGDALKSTAYSREDSAYREYLVKLRNVPEKMTTISGKRLALKRAEFMKRFFDQLNSEVSGEV